jgi:hypothetical protein
MPMATMPIIDPEKPVRWGSTESLNCHIGILVRLLLFTILSAWFGDHTIL